MIYLVRVPDVFLDDLQDTFSDSIVGSGILLQQAFVEFEAESEYAARVLCANKLDGDFTLTTGFGANHRVVMVQEV